MFFDLSVDLDSSTMREAGLLEHFSPLRTLYPVKILDVVFEIALPNFFCIPSGHLFSDYQKYEKSASTPAECGYNNSLMNFLWKLQFICIDVQ